MELSAIPRPFRDAHRDGSGDVNYYEKNQRNPETYRAYMREYMAARYERRKRDLVRLLGGRCCACGSRVRLEFDHRIPRSKLFTICDRLAGIASLKLRREIAKCQLLCEPCHKLKHGCDTPRLRAHIERLGAP